MLTQAVRVVNIHFRLPPIGMAMEKPGDATNVAHRFWMLRLLSFRFTGPAYAVHIFTSTHRRFTCIACVCPMLPDC